MNSELARLRSRAIRLLRKYDEVGVEERTPILRRLAEVLVEARGLFERPDGSPDWKGRSYPYRSWVRDLFSEAGIAQDDHATVQAAVRYHVGSVLRDRLDEDTLADYDLIPRSPRERSADRRQGRTALLNALTARDVAGGGLNAIVAAQTVLSRVRPGDVDELKGPAAQVARESLADVERRARSLKRRLETRE